MQRNKGRRVALAYQSLKGRTREGADSCLMPLQRVRPSEEQPWLLGNTERVGDTEDCHHEVGLGAADMGLSPALQASSDCLSRHS